MQVEAAEKAGKSLVRESCSQLLDASDQRKSSAEWLRFFQKTSSILPGNTAPALAFLPSSLFNIVR